MLLYFYNGNTKKENTYMNVNTRIKNLREEFNIDQKTLADKIGLNASVMNRIELGTRPVRDEELSKIADYFGVSVDYLLGRTNIRNYEENTIAAHTDDRTQQLSEEGRKRLDDFIDYLIFEEMKKKND